MNERMAELFGQAGISDSINEEFGIEYLAELIVRECITTVEGIEPGYKDYRDQIEDAFRRDCVAEIKHKFGVK